MPQYNSNKRVDEILPQIGIQISRIPYLNKCWCHYVTLITVSTKGAICID